MKCTNQMRILSLLAISKGRGEESLTTKYVAKKLKLKVSQVERARQELFKKGLLVDKNKINLSLKGYYAHQETEKKPFINKVCRFLVRRERNDYFCIIRGVYIDCRNHREMCGCLQYNNHSNPLDGVFYRPYCKGWTN